MRKENQGIRDAGQIGRVSERTIWDAGQISLPRKRPSGMPANLTGSPTLSLLDLRFCPVRLLFGQMDVGIATVAATFFRFLGLLAATRATATAWFGATAARSATFTFWLLRRVWLFRI